jgi:hypothetical protein
MNSLFEFGVGADHHSSEIRPGNPSLLMDGIDLTGQSLPNR